MDKKNTAGRGEDRGRIGERSGNGAAGSFRTASSGAGRSREEYYERYSEPGRIDRPFTRRMEREAAQAAAQPAPEPEKKKKRERKKRVRDPEKKIFTWKRVLIGILILLAVGLALIIIFGERGTHHEMPVITPPESTEETVGG